MEVTKWLKPSVRSRYRRMRSAAVLALLVTFGPPFFVTSISAARAPRRFIEPIVHDVRTVIAQLAVAQVEVPAQLVK